MKRFMESLDRFNTTEDPTSGFKCLPVTKGILVYISIHCRFIYIERQHPVFVKRRIHILFNNTPHLIFKPFHPFRMATDTRESVSDGRIARCRIRDDVYGCGIKSVAASVCEIVCLQAVREIEDDLAAIVCERQRICKDVLCTDSPCKVVTFPVRTVSREMAFDDAIVT